MVFDIKNSIVVDETSKAIKNIENHILALEDKVTILKKQLNTLAKIDHTGVNKDGIPIDIDIYAEVDGIGEIVLHVLRDKYQVKKIGDISIIKEARTFNSLSAAAEFFSKIKRKSGWIFWRTVNGKTLKETYKG